MSTSKIEKKINKEINWGSRSFPTTPYGRVKYAMAVANHLLNHIHPTKENPVRLEGTDGYAVLHLWTALMVWGEHHPSIKFGSEAISADACFFDIRKQLGNWETWFMQEDLFSWPRFSRNSCYETVFKYYLTDDMLVVRDYPQAFHGIPNSTYMTIEEQEAFKIEEARIQEEPRIREEVRIQEEARIREEVRTQEEARAREEPGYNHENQHPGDQKETHIQEETSLEKEARRKQENLDRIKQNEKLVREAKAKEKAAEKEKERKRAEEYRQKKEAEAKLELIRLINDSNPTSMLRVSQLLKTDIDINHQDPETGNTALMYAISRQKEHIAEYLLNNEANPLLRNKRGETARDLCSSSHPLFELLKKRERILELNKLAPRKRYSILLHEHVRSFEVSIQKINELLDLGADINYQDSTGFSPLMYTLDMQNERIAEYLLCRGANPLLANKQNMTARSLVSRNSGMYQIIKGYELLFVCMGNNLPAVKSLLTNDNSLIDFQGSRGFSALFIAVEFNFKQIVEFLLLHNPNLALTCNDGRTVFEVVNDGNIKSLLIQANNSLNEELPVEPEENNSKKYSFF